MAHRRTNSRRKYRNRRSHGPNWTRIGLGSVAALTVATTISAAAFTVYKDANTEKINATNFCWERKDQPVTAVFLDASHTAENSDAQDRDYRAGLNRTWREASANTRIDFYTTAKGQGFSVAEPVFSVCKPPANAQEQEAIGAPKMQPNRLGKIHDDAKQAWIEGTEALLETAADRARAASHSPLIESVNAISRSPSFSGPYRTLVMFSDAIQNSPELGQFCVKQGHMPPYDRYKERPEYQFHAPRLEGVSVDLYLVEHGELPNGSLKFCSNLELRTWWTDLFQDRGATTVDLSILRYWQD